MPYTALTGGGEQELAAKETLEGWAGAVVGAATLRVGVPMDPLLQLLLLLPELLAPPSLCHREGARMVKKKQNFEFSDKKNWQNGDFNVRGCFLKNKIELGISTKKEN